MWMDPKDTRKQLSAIWKNDKVLTLETKRKKYVLMGDLHLGNGGGADDFFHNEKALLNALEYYRNNNYSIILMGDIEELWQFDLPEITSRYSSTIYSSIKKFGDKKIFRIHGNHDFKWRGMRDPVFNKSLIVGTAAEAIKLRDINNRISILLLHGHQGNLDSDKYKFLGNLGARVYRYIEPICKKIFPSKSSSKPMSNIPDNYEAIYYSWAKRAKVIVCCGHTHRAIFASISYIERLQKEIEELEKEIKECSDEGKIKNLISKIDEKNRTSKN